LGLLYEDDNKIHSINNKYYLYNLFSIYDFNKKKTPIEITYKLIREKNLIDTGDIPFEILLKHGLVLNEEQWKTLETLFHSYDISYSPVTLSEDNVNKI
ncbi:MAG: hypothetical protein J6B98_06115, partial [Bacilli bacterium]|nr:hypothetical protein [Bacilli bacterium]